MTHTLSLSALNPCCSPCRIEQFPFDLYLGRRWAEMGNRERANVERLLGSGA